MRNWRAQPAELVENVLADHCNGKYPPSLEDLVAIADRYRFQVYFDDLLTTALTCHSQRVIFLPETKPETMHRMLLHEIAEVLLRMPVAPEYHYVPSDLDEFHEVATVIQRRAESRRQLRL